MGTAHCKSMGMHRPCLGCAFGWGLLAVLLVCVALGTDFWFFGSRQTNYTPTAGTGNSTSTWKATAYGVIDFCLYESDKDWTINTGDSAWECTKWEDLPSQAGMTGDCRKAAANGLAWGIMGLLATAPAAVICLLTCFCAEKCMGNCMGKVISFLTLGCLLFATVAFMIAPAVLAGQCKDENETNAKLVGKDDFHMHYSFYCCISAIFAALISLCCYLTFFCTKPVEDCEDGHAQQPSHHAEFKDGQQA